MSRSKQRKAAASARDSGPFLALPYVVLESPAYRGLSVHAKALLIDVASQYRGSNNGALLCSRAKMVEFGWTSNDMLTKSKRELLESKLLFQTVMGQRPNKASWYAVTWLALAKLDGYDAGAVETFRRGMYRIAPLVTPKTQALDRPTGQRATG